MEILLLKKNRFVGRRDITKLLPRHPEKKYKKRPLSKIKRIVVHTTDMEIDPYELAKFDIGPNHISSSGCPAITYHELVMPNGFVYKTLDFNEISWHAGPWNTSSIAIAMSFKATDPKTGKDRWGPTDKALAAVVRECGRLCLKLGIEPTKVVGHRELYLTGWFWVKGSKRLRKTCPGLKVDLEELRRMVIIYVQQRLKFAKLLDVVDGIYGPKTRAALKEYVRSK